MTFKNVGPLFLIGYNNEDTNYENMNRLIHGMFSPMNISKWIPYNMKKRNKNQYRVRRDAKFVEQICNACN